MGPVDDRAERRHTTAGQEYLNQIRELRRAIGYDAEHVTNPALLAWSGAP